MNNRSSRSRTRGAATVAVMLGVALGFGATVHGAGREHPRVSDRTGETRRVEERARPTAAIPSREAAAARRLARERARRIAPPVMPQPTVSLADAAQQYTRELDQTAKLLRSWSELGLAARQREQIGRLLGAKTAELRTAGALLEEKFARIRAALLEHGTPAQQAEFDAFVREFRSRHEEVRDDLTAVGSSATAGGQQAAVSRLLGKLEGLRSRETRRRDRPTGQIGRPLPSQPVEFDKDAPSRESTVRPAYLGGGGAELMGDLDPTPDAQITPEIQALADSLGNSAVRIYEFVRDNTTFEPYFGSLKGSQAALETLAGNDYDLASLTIALLRASNIPARYVRGTVKIPTARAQDWLSVRHPDAVNQILNTAGISAIAIDFGGNGTVDWFEVDRVWVEAQVPHANYRGVDGSGGGAVWVPLDPAFKLRRHQAGISGIPDSVPFDENGYLAARTSLLAYEWYQNQVRAWLETNMPDKGLGDVPYKGTIQPEPLGVLPASLPHEAIAFTGEWAELPENLRHRFQVTLLNQFGGTVLDRAGLRTVETALKRVTISYSDGTDSAGLSAALGGTSEVPEFLVTLTPELKIEGVVDTTGTTVDSGDPIDIRVRYFFPDDSPIETVIHPRTAGEYHALTFDSHQVSETLLDRRSELLIAANADVGTPAEDPDALTGELLNLVGLRYWQRVAQGDEALGELYQFRSVKQWFEILAGSNTTVQYLYDRPFAVTPGNLGVDSQSQSKGQFGIDGDQTKSAELFKIEGRNGSAQEHAIWEEIVHVDSVSTIKSLQFANETDINGNGTPNDGDVLDLTVPGQTSLLCPGFPGSVSSSMEAALSAGQVVKTPYCDFVMNDWNGVGWIEEDPATGAGAYLISGFLAGGETTTASLAALAGSWSELSRAAGRRMTACAERQDVETVEIEGGAATAGLGALPPTLLAHLARTLGAGDRATVTTESVTCDGREGYVVAIRDGTGRVSYGLSSMTRGGSGTCNPPGSCPPGQDPNDSDDPCGSGGQPVSYANGNMFHTFADLLIPGPDLPLMFQRTYRSNDPQDGPLGFGWTHNYNVFLVDDPGVSATIHDETGSRRVFSDNGDGTYDAPPGVHQTLTQTAGGWNLRFKNGKEYDFDTAGRLVVIRARTGGEQTLSYDGSGNLQSVTDVLTRSLSFGYDGNNHLTSLSDFTGRSWSFSYDAAFDLVSSSTPTDGVTPSYTITYDYHTVSYNAHRLKSFTDPRGDSVEFAYYANGKTYRHIEPGGLTTTYVYQPLKRETTTIGERGQEWKRRYDADGRIVETINPAGHSIRTTWDAEGNRLSVTDRLGQTTSFTYDASGNMTSSTDPLLRTRSYTYDPDFSRMTSSTDARLKTTNYTVDPVNGNVTRIDYPTAAFETFAHNAHGQITSRTDANGKTTLFRYDANGYLQEREDALNNITAYTNNAVGRRLTTTDPALQPITREYDVLGRMTRTIDPLTGATAFAYDSVNNLVSITDAEMRQSLMTYDERGNLLSSTAPDGGIVQYEYGLPDCGCKTDLLTAVTDPLGRVTRFEYDFDGNLIAKTDPLGNRWYYDYNANGKLVRRSHDDGTWIGYDYDEAGQLVTKSYSDGRSFTFSYDDNGNLLTAVSPENTLTYVYDDMNRATSVTDSRLGGKTILYGYDPVGSRDSMTDPESGVTSYVYDDTKRLSSVTHPGPATVSFTYDAASRPLTVTYPNGTTGTFGYDALGRVTSIDYETSLAAPLLSRSYTYDLTSLLTSQTDEDGTHSYQYDDAERLVSAQHPLTPDETYLYDEAGQRTEAASGFSFVSNQAGQLIQRGATGYLYDQRGNLVRKLDADGGITDYTWNPENQLERIDLPGGSVVQYRYDAIGRRIEKDVDGTRTLYVYDQLDVLMEYDGAGTVLARYGFGDRVDRPWIVTKSGATYALYHDRLQSLIAASDATEALVSEYSYDSFGNIIALSGTKLTDFAFTGRPFDDESGLYYFRARYYDPVAGRFTSPDPLGFVNGIDLYAYTNNTPLNNLDPTGEFLDTLLDIGFILYDIYRIVADNIIGDCDNLGENLLALGLDVGGALIPFATGGGAAARAGRGALEVADSGTDLARQAGRAGEEAAGIIKNTDHIPSASGTANYRIPDQLLHEQKIISEVKNVNYQSYTNQLKDFASYAKDKGYTFELYVRPDTRLSGPLQEAVAKGEIVLCFIGSGC